MIWDRLGVISDEVSHDFIEALDWIQAEGLKYVEIRMVDGINIANLTDEQVERVRQEVDNRSLHISALASPLFKCALDPSRPVEAGDRFGQEEESVETHFDKLARTIEIANKLGTSLIRIFSFWREKEPDQFVDEVAGHLKKAAEIAARHNITLLLENEGSCNGGYAFEVAKLIRKVNAPSLKALWDPGNEALGKHWSYPEVYNEVKELLAHVHLKDALIESGGKPSCVPIGSGRVPYVQQIQDLENEGYTGLYVIETHYIPPGGSKMEGTKQSLEGLRKLFSHPPLKEETAEHLKVKVFENRQIMGAAAAVAAATKIKELLSRKDKVRMIFAAAPSQNEFLAELVNQQGIDWSRITAFHMDEYIGLPDDAPQKFSQFLTDRLFKLVKPGELHLIQSSTTIEQECQRYSDLIAAAPIDIICLGIGENGHIAFNDPPVADFEDSFIIKPVELDAPCRQQQVNDGCFPDFDAVPTHALTLTIPTMMAGAHLFCIVPGSTKRAAVEQTLRGPISTSCPASILRTHPDCTLYVDRDSYGMLQVPQVSTQGGQA
ncbi:TIM barrel protein [Paenibacillus sp. P36]|uniref:TIM barrel protein n=1 Tax=Paenibacillus sp. P36 TaxID=3342538 RepID=UPI0038B411B3